MNRNIYINKMHFGVHSDNDWMENNSMNSN